MPPKKEDKFVKDVETALTQIKEGKGTITMELKTFREAIKKSTALKDKEIEELTKDLEKEIDECVTAQNNVTKVIIQRDKLKEEIKRLRK